MNVVITGASRGIGLELTKLALERGDQVLAVARKPDESTGLKELTQKYKDRLTTLAADLKEAGAPAQIAVAVSGWPSVDVLINNAGILLQGEKLEDFMESFQVNSVVPFFVTKALLPALKKSKTARVVQITSKMGSIADNTSGGYYVYRSSKSALNMINMSLSRDNPWLTTVVMHPGWVQTDMGGKNAPLAPADSAKGIWQVALELRPDQTGKFIEYSGKEIPW